MRKIKFRAWDDTDKRMVWLDYIWNEWWYGSPQGGNGKAVYFNDNKSMDERRHAGFHIMQFTGLKDKNGKEIWEGDIVKFSDNVIHEGVLAKCFWSEKTVQFIYEFLTGDNKGKCTDMIDDWRKYEVIGNIYENPDLLQADGKED